MPVSFMHQHPARAEPNTLRYKLHKGLNGVRPGRDLGTLHASDMTGDKSFCPRNRVIMQLKGMPPPSDYVSMSTRATWDFGNDVEQRAINWLATIGIAVGDWRCACGHMHYMKVRPLQCSGCGSMDPDGFVYKQRRFASNTSRISCGIDCFVTGMGPKLRVVEIKSAMKEDFAKILAPLVEHRERTSLYLRCISESMDKDVPLIDTEVGHVLYVCKGGFIKDPEVEGWKFGDRGFTPVKDFEIKRDEKLTDPLVAQATTYVNAVETKTIPPRTCVQASDKRAMECQTSMDCFGKHFPVGSKWG